MSMRIRAPELDAGLAWLNSDRPLRFAQELKGQVVVLDFWTYCCINCMHILPDLAYLEHKYRSEPVVFIGVHSAKFSNETSREAIRAAILRYEIQHPVVVDDQMRIWRAYTARSWPTLVVVDSTGSIVGTVAGEGNRQVMDDAIARALESGRTNGTLAAGPLTLRREASVRATSGLAFPGKVLVDAPSKRIFVADSNHNRIVVADWPDAEGRSRVIKAVGKGTVGRDDGPADQATFNHPQGLAVVQGKLYVTDTENHLIRAVDLSTYSVMTVVGTGEMCNDRAGGGMGTRQGLNSPWDLTVEGSTLYVAMAGVHQIWRIDLPVGFARALAGSGRENIVDGPTETAALAQPSGICMLDGKIYFADSEVSAIRGIDLASEQVFTVIGEGLFSFGDVDGAYPHAKLQHPLGVAPWRGSLLVADTYNHKIKRVDPGAKSSVTLFGTGRPETSTTDGDVGFFEPGGLCVAGDELFVADTNNHRVVRINLVTKAWHEIALQGLDSLANENGRSPQAIAIPAIAIADGKDVEVRLDLRLPKRGHVNSEAPWSIQVLAGDEPIAQRTGKSANLPLTVTIPAASARTGVEWTVTASLAYCTDSDGGACIPAEIVWRVPVRGGGTSTHAVLEATIDEGE
ncbi:MAG: thioredoxin-like domain-containing protein [Planctomycetota bacterium]